jgi:hypothetical protein
VLLGVDPEVLDAVLHAWLAAFEPPAARTDVLRAVAVDGKTARGAVREDGTRAAFLSMVAHERGVPLGQVEITATGENAVLAARLVTLVERVGELERRVGQSPRNSNRPPPSEGYDKPAPRPRREPSDRKPAGQPGAPGKDVAPGGAPG